MTNNSRGSEDRVGIRYKRGCRRDDGTGRGRSEAVRWKRERREDGGYGMEDGVSEREMEDRGRTREEGKRTRDEGRRLGGQRRSQVERRSRRRRIEEA